VGGYRGRLSGEITYLFSEHDSFFDDGAIIHYTSTYYDILSFDVKYSFIGRPSENLSVYGLFGVGFPRFKVNDGAYNGDTLDWIDESLTGISYSLGIGCSLTFGSKLSLNFEYIGRRIDIERLDTADSHNETPADDLRTVNRAVVVSMSYHF
jgi:hypothetical protein